MKKLFLSVLVALAVAGCTVDTSQADRALSAMGVTQVKIEGYAWFGCAEKDTFRSKFSGVGMNGQRVTGVVCSGWLKGTTVRFD